MEGNERLENVVKIYENLESILNSLPDQIPELVRNKIKDAILNDQELKQLVDDIKNRRPPRFLLIGNSGHGKSSLINAIVGYYRSHVSSVKIGTRESETYDVTDENGEVQFSVLDSRGINESTIAEDDAENQLLDEMSNFTPDAVLYVHKAKERASMNNEIKFLKRIKDGYHKKTNQNLPIIVVLSQCDEIDPSSKKEPSTYNQRKLDNIDLAKKEVERIVEEFQLEVKDVIVTSSLMEYEQSYEELEDMTPQQLKALKPETDGRYQIDELKEILYNSIEDLRAQMGAATTFRVNEVLKSIAKKFTHSFAAIAGTIALTPIPVSDAPILFALEGVLVMIIAALSGRKISYKVACEMITSFGGIGAVGLGAKVLAQQASKLLNGLLPGAGSAISGGIAAGGVELIGELSIKYFFSDTSQPTGNVVVVS